MTRAPASRGGTAANAAPAASATANATTRSAPKWTPWSCSHHHGCSASVSETICVLIRWPSGIVAGRTPAASAAAATARHHARVDAGAERDEDERCEIEVVALLDPARLP